MRVFVAGATGVMGRALVPKLRAAGHEVTGMSRSEERAQALRASGVDAVVCDAFDREGLAAALTAARPEVVVHQLTDIPQAIDMRRYAEQFEGNDRLRVEGTRNLVDAALAAGARRMVAQSIAFVYDFGGAGLKTEDDPLFDDAPPPFGRGVAAVRSLERAVTETEGIEGLVLRYGYFYGPGTAYARDGFIAELARKRQLPIVGRGTGVYSMIHVDDGADAAVAAVESSATGIFNIVDDDPAPGRELVPAFAAAVGAPRTRRVPRWLAGLVVGRAFARTQTDQKGASNERAKAELGWRPRHPSWRQGFTEL